MTTITLTNEQLNTLLQALNSYRITCQTRSRRSASTNVIESADNFISAARAAELHTYIERSINNEQN